MNMTYSRSGVDISKENKAIKALSNHLTFKRKGMGAPLIGIGHYAGLIDLGEFALAITTDGIGSKALIANAIKRWDTVGIDCIAMNVNDLLAIGAEPLAFVDYIAMSYPNEKITEQIGIGLQRGAESPLWARSQRGSWTAARKGNVWQTRDGESDLPSECYSLYLYSSLFHINHPCF